MITNSSGTEESKPQRLIREAVTLRYAGEDVPAMTDGEFILLRDFIYRQSGIYFTDAKKFLLHARIFHLLRETSHKNFSDYYRFISKENIHSQAVKALFDSITINETFFFRNKDQFSAMEIAIRNILAESPQKKNFRIWSAACSTGEEPYTIAIYLREKIFPSFPDISFEVLASDIGETVVAQAEKAVYRDYAVKNIPSDIMERYFSCRQEKYFLSNEIKRLVSFRTLNLYDESEISAMREFDIIFCCNVMIYFDLPSKKKVLSNIYRALGNGGYLFVGYSESLHGISRPFHLIHLPKALAYRKI